VRSFPHRRAFRSIRRVTVSATLASLLLVIGVIPASAATPSPFATVQQPISVAAASSRILATRFCADRVLAISQAGAITTFANLPSTGNQCLARDVVVSPGLGGFQAGVVFAVQKQTIYRIPANGGNARAFVTIPSLQSSETSLTFDTVGTFGFNLIATGRLGEIWRITPSRTTTLVTNLGHHIEGAQMAPSGFAPFGGQLLGTNDFTNSIFAVSASGVESTVAAYDQPESVEFVPTQVCEFLSTQGALFVASQFGDLIYKFPATDFGAIDDGLHALVMSKTGKIGLLSTTGITDFASGLETELEDATFALC
jgi:hypothetical protein